MNLKRQHLYLKHFRYYAIQRFEGILQSKDVIQYKKAVQREHEMSTHRIEDRYIR